MIPGIEESKSQDKQKIVEKQQALLKPKILCLSFFLQNLNY